MELVRAGLNAIKVWSRQLLRGHKLFWEKQKLLPFVFFIRFLAIFNLPL